MQSWCLVRSYVADTKRKEWTIDSMRSAVQALKTRKYVP
jgi:hypothetical protein